MELTPEQRRWRAISIGVMFVPAAAGLLGVFSAVLLLFVRAHVPMDQLDWVGLLSLHGLAGAAFGCLVAVMWFRAGLVQLFLWDPYFTFFANSETAADFDADRPAFRVWPLALVFVPLIVAAKVPGAPGWADSVVLAVVVLALVLSARTQFVAEFRRLGRGAGAAWGGYLAVPLALVVGYLVGSFSLQFWLLAGAALIDTLSLLFIARRVHRLSPSPSPST